VRVTLKVHLPCVLETCTVSYRNAWWFQIRVMSAERQHLEVSRDKLQTGRKWYGVLARIDNRNTT
jgi:hypothetical protein